MKTEPISTTNITGLRHSVRGSSLRSASGSGAPAASGSSSPPPTRRGGRRGPVPAASGGVAGPSGYAVERSGHLESLRERAERERGQVGQRDER